MLMRKMLMNTRAISVLALGTFCNTGQSALVNPLRHRQVVASCRLGLAHRPQYLPNHRDFARLRGFDRFPCPHQLGLSRGSDRVPKDIAATPYCLDVMTSAGRLGEFFSELADEDVNDLDLGLFGPAIEVVEDHCFRQGRTLVEDEQFQDVVLLAGQAHRAVIDQSDALIQVHH